MHNDEVAVATGKPVLLPSSQPACPSHSGEYVEKAHSLTADRQHEHNGLIDERRRLAAENDALRQTMHELDARHQAMLDGALQGIVIHQDSVICYANSAAARMFDYSSADELLGREVFETLSAAEDRPGLRARTETLYRGTARPAVASWRAMSDDGSDVWVTSTASLITWRGRPAVSVFLQDDTRQRRSEQLLQEREALLRSITDHTDDVIFVKDRDSRMLFMNPAGFRAIGLSPSKVLGHTDEEFLSDHELAASFLAADLRVMESRHAATIEEELPSANGERRLFLTRKTPRLNADGDVIGVVGVTRDITEEQRMQREILEIAADENRRIGQDLHDGAGQQLAGLAYMAEALLNELREKSLPEVVLAERVVATVKKAQTLIRGYSRGLIPVDIEADGLRFALERLADTTELASGIRCVVQCPQPVCIGNNHAATQLYRIAQEAVTNVLRHANAQRIEVELTANESGLRLSILDDGVGLPAKTNNEGFGLRIMQYRARLMGASLNIQPETPHGTRITCWLPIKVSVD